MNRKHASCAAAHLRGLTARLLFVALAAAAPVCAVAWAANAGVTEEAILRSDWSTLARAADSGQDPVTAMVRGHALLALNRNDESVCQFAGADAFALRGWDEWTRAFLQRNPTHPVAAYLRGDALARLGQRDAAIEQFTLGLRKQPRDRMMLNARGVALALGGKWDHALLDFKAAEAAGGLADAAANSGVTGLLQGQTADVVAAHFDRALKLSPRFALARAGRASAKLAMRQSERAQEDAEVVAKSPGCIPGLVGRAVIDAVNAFRSREETAVASATTTDVGVMLQRQLDNFERGDPGAVKKIMGILADHPEHIQAVRQAFDGLAAKDPRHGIRANDAITAELKRYSPEGSTAATLAAWKDVTVRAGGEVSVAQGKASNRTTVTGTVDVELRPQHSAELQSRINEARYKNLLPLAPPKPREGIWPEGQLGDASSESTSVHWDLGDVPVIALFGLYYTPVGGARP